MMPEIADRMLIAIGLNSADQYELLRWKDFVNISLLLTLYKAPLDLSANFWAKVLDPYQKTHIEIEEAWQTMEKIS